MWNSVRLCSILPAFKLELATQYRRNYDRCGYSFSVHLRLPFSLSVCQIFDACPHLNQFFVYWWLVWGFCTRSKWICQPWASNFLGNSISKWKDLSDFLRNSANKWKDLSYFLRNWAKIKWKEKSEIFFPFDLGRFPMELWKNGLGCWAHTSALPRRLCPMAWKKSWSSKQSVFWRGSIWQIAHYFLVRTTFRWINDRAVWLGSVRIGSIQSRISKTHFWTKTKNGKMVA